MIALDTNVLIRYLVRDDPRQTASATRVIETECTADRPGVITWIVLAEVVWVLDRAYDYDRVQISRVLRAILTAEELSVERPDLAWRALGEYREGKADFADCLIGLGGIAAGAEATCTFDRRTAQSSLFRLLKS